MNGGNSHPNMKTRMALLLSHRLVFCLPRPNRKRSPSTLKEKDHRTGNSDKGPPEGWPLGSEATAYFLSAESQDIRNSLSAFPNRAKRKQSPNLPPPDGRDFAENASGRKVRK